MYTIYELYKGSIVKHDYQRAELIPDIYLLEEIDTETNLVAKDSVFDSHGNLVQVFTYLDIWKGVFVTRIEGGELNRQYKECTKYLEALSWHGGAINAISERDQVNQLLQSCFSI